MSMLGVYWDQMLVIKPHSFNTLSSLRSICTAISIRHTVVFVLPTHSQKYLTYSRALGANESWCLAAVTKKLESTENFKHEVNTGNSHLDSGEEAKRWKLKLHDERWKGWSHCFDYWTLQERYLEKDWKKS